MVISYVDTPGVKWDVLGSFRHIWQWQIQDLATGVRKPENDGPLRGQPERQRRDGRERQRAP